MSSRENNSAKQKREWENANSHSLLCRRRRVNFNFYFWVIATLADFSPTNINTSFLSVYYFVVYVFVVKSSHFLYFLLTLPQLQTKHHFYTLSHTHPFTLNGAHFTWISFFFLFCSVLPLFVLCFGDIKPAFLYFVNNNYSFS